MTSASNMGEPSGVQTPSNISQSALQDIRSPGKAILYRLKAVLKWSPIQVAIVRSNLIRRLEQQKGELLSPE